MNNSKSVVVCSSVKWYIVYFITLLPSIYKQVWVKKCVCLFTCLILKKKRKERGFALLKAEIIMLAPSIAPQLLTSYTDSVDP